MAIQQRLGPQPWYTKYEKLVQWLTLLLVVVGGIAHYFFIDLPSVRSVEETRKLTRNLTEESKRNQALLEQRLLEAKANTDALATNVTQMKAQVELARAQIDQLNDPTRKASDKLALAKLRVDQTRSVDELVESLRPNMQISLLPTATWKDNYIAFNFVIKNASPRTIIVDEPKISITMNPSANSEGGQTLPRLPRADEVVVAICTAGHVPPGDAFPCGASLSTKVSTAGIKSLSYVASFSARTDISEDSKTWRMISAEYPATTLTTKLRVVNTMRGQVHP